MKKFTLKTLFLAGLFLLSVRSQGQDVLTQHNDLNRTAWNPNETILNQSNVTPTSFGLLYKKAVDDQIYAQPLFVSGVMIDGAPHNVVYVATVNNSVYAFDTDDGTLDPYWQKNLTMAGKQVPVASDVHSSFCNGGYADFSAVMSGQSNGYGIVGTPVIDKGRNVIYLVSRSRDLTVDNAARTGSGGGHYNDWDWSSTGFYQQFHALSLITGNDTLNSPVNIDNTISVNGTGDGAVSNVIHFDPRRENQRAGLVLSNNVVYVTYAAHCDMDYYHGWILGFNAANLSLVTKYMSTPNDGRGGIWMSGAAPAVDAAGNFYFASGNALPNVTGNSQDNMGLRIVRTQPNGTTFNNLSWFKPLSYTSWNANQADLDFGTGVLLIPSANLLITAHKSGNLVLLRETPTITGEFNENDNTNFLGYVPIGGGNESHSGLSYYGGTANQWVYQFSENTNVQAYPVTAAPGLGIPISNSSVPTNNGFQGGFLTVSSNGSSDASAILWVEHKTSSGGALHALKANDVTKELWNSDALPVDNLGNYSKMNTPTVANGKVFAPTFSNSLNVYGLLANNTRCVTNVALNKPTTGSPSTENANPASNATDGDPNTRWGAGGLPAYVYVDLQGRYDICKIDIQWDRSVNYPINYNIDISDDAISWTPIESIVNSTFPLSALTSFNENSTTRYVRISVQSGSQFSSSVSEFQVYGSPANSCIPPTGLTATAGLNTAVLSWSPVASATQYIVKYKTAGVDSYITRIVPNTGNPVTKNISALTCGFSYTYYVQTDCGSGSLSDPVSATAQENVCGFACGPSQHFSHADLGDVQVAGMSCFNAPTYTVTGAGNGLGANSDQFQYEYKPVYVDEDFVARVAAQDQVAPLNSNLAGLMMRDSVTDISRFIFIGKTGDDSKIFMIYRTAPGATAVSASIPKPAGADYFRLLKSGNTFSAFYGSAQAGPWTKFGNSDVTLAFSNLTSNMIIGMAVSSLNPNFASTATFDNFLENSVPLPVTLLNFTAVNRNGIIASLKWQTAMEHNNDHFDIERSADGTHFYKILTVKAAGNSDTVRTYTADDNTPLQGINFYRLKQVDLDNQFSYSNVVTVKFGTEIPPVVYPNPVTTLFTVVQGAEPIHELVIYNVQGRAVQYAKNNFPGNDMLVNISSLSAGVYFIKLKTDSKVYQVKIVKE